MKRMTQVLFLGLLLSVSSVALAGHDHDRDGRRGHHGDRNHHAHQYDRRGDRRHNGHHHARYVNHAPRHSHHGRYCNAWHPRGYVTPVVRYGYGEPGLVIIYQPDAGLYLGAGR